MIDQARLEELQHLGSVLEALCVYDRHVRQRWDREVAQRASQSNSEQVRCLVAQRGIRVHEALDTNRRFCLQLRQSGASAFLTKWAKTQEEFDRVLTDSNAHDRDINKVTATLRQFAREWSAEGAREREHLHKYFIDNLKQHCESRASVLVPGCGLGRLAFDLAKEGFRVETNEVSYQMLCGMTLLFMQQHPQQWRLCPFVDTFDNVTDTDSQCRQITVPDVSMEGLDDLEISFCAGHFFEQYQDRHFDAVATCFFIDAVPDVEHCIRLIHDMLPDGGVWVNSGPLTWHVHDNEEPPLRLSFQELLKVIESAGFTLLHSSMREDGISGYADNEQSLNVRAYRLGCFVARKNDTSPFSVSSTPPTARDH
ncbi:MAG: hypothetical protein MHM6MM_000304 [Cercozoa sp. M6MM]